MTKPPNSNNNITLVFFGLLAVWLFVALPLIYLPGPISWLETARHWQTLIGACIAIVAAVVTWHNTSRTLKANLNLETKRRSQKHAALRATLPLSLSELSSYCLLTVRVLASLWGHCVDGALPREGEAKPRFPSMPSETVQAFADFIEYSDHLDTSLFRTMLARLQVSRARIQDLLSGFDDATGDTLILEINIEDYILDAASIYAAVAAAFDYGREKTDTLPNEITWDGVRSALRNMKIWDFDIPPIFETIQRRESDGISP